MLFAVSTNSIKDRLRKYGEELARSLRLTEGTVRNYLSEAISKLHASSRFEAARIARNKGWL